MIAWSEGTSCVKGSDNGYNVLCGGSLFQGYVDHPRKAINLPKLGIKSTAAGRYQLLSRYFDVYKEMLKLPDFSPTSQDAIAIQQLKECHALADIDEGRFEAAVHKCCRIWASLPGAGYGQRENKIESLKLAYQKAGGSLA